MQRQSLLMVAVRIATIASRASRATAVALAVLASYPVSVSAQTSYSIAFTSSAQQDTDLIEIIADDNNKTCLRLGLAIGCNQGQACTTPGTTCVGGVSCSAAQARACNARIFSSSSTANREEFLLHSYIVPRFNSDVQSLPSSNQTSACRNWQSFNQTQRNSACTAFGLTAPCRLCQ